MKWKFKKTLVRLLRMNNTPAEVALGVALGVFIAILPFYGFHTLMVLAAAVLIRKANKIAILAGTNISLPPTVPFITWAGYEIGKIFLKGDYPALGWVDFKKITFQKVINLYPPLLLGSFILGIACAAVFYGLAFFTIKILMERKRHAVRN